MQCPGWSSRTISGIYMAIMGRASLACGPLAQNEESDCRRRVVREGGLPD